MGEIEISFRGQGKKVKAMTLEERHSPGASGLEVLHDDSGNTLNISAIKALGSP
jgi:urease alpha subunit